MQLQATRVILIRKVNFGLAGKDFGGKSENGSILYIGPYGIIEKGLLSIHFQLSLSSGSNFLISTSLPKGVK